MIESLLNFRGADSTENINARLSGLIPKGVVKGGLVVPEPASLQVRVKGDGVSPFVILAFATDGMVIRELSEEHILPVTAGITSVLCLRAKYVSSIGGTIARFEILSLGNYQTDPDPDSLIRLCSISPPAGVTAVESEHINLGFRDSIEGFTRKIVRGVVDTKEDLPAVSGFPAIAEINFLKNSFALGTSITIGTQAGAVGFPIVAAGSYRISSPSEPGLSRSNPSQKNIVSISRNAITGLVTVVTDLPHGFVFGGGSGTTTMVRITGCSAAKANQNLWLLTGVLSAFSFTTQDNASLGEAWSGTGGNVLDISVPAVVVAKVAAGITHDLITGQQIRIKGVSDPTFNSNSLTFTITDVPNSRTIVYHQSGYPTADSGNGYVSKEGYILPVNSVEIGESGIATAKNFETVFNASILGTDIRAIAMGSSNQLEAMALGEVGNGYTLTKSEPNVSANNQSIVLSGDHFIGGTEPNPSTSNVDLQSGDLYVVLFGTSGTLEIWGYDGAIFRNLTSASTATMLDFHRRNQFLNEGHLTENQKNALEGTVGTPSASNKFVTQEDTGVLTSDISEALTGADGVAPNSGNRYITEARRRGEVGMVTIPEGQDWIAIPMSDGENAWQIVLGEDQTFDPTNQSKKAIRFFNVVRADSIFSAGGPTEYSLVDFSAVVVTKVYTGTHPNMVEIDPVNHMDTVGVFPRSDSGKPTTLWVKLSATLDNDDGVLLFSKVVTERKRKPSADMFATPQRLLPAAFQDIVNKVRELRFNAGIAIQAASTTRKTIIQFPANLFSASNVQGFTLRRMVNSRPTAVVNSFSIDFEAGSDGTGVIAAFSPITKPSGTDQWTKYLLSLTTSGKIKVTHIANLLEKATDVAFATQLTSVALPSASFSDGCYTFASIGVLLNGTSGSTQIADIDPTSIELYPYQGTNDRETGAPIICGDGSSSFGHFTGADAHIRAMKLATSGSRIYLASGTYSGSIALGSTLLINKSSITVEGCGNTILSSALKPAITVVGDRCTLRNLIFQCITAIDVQSGADNLYLDNLVYGNTVTTKIKSPSIYSFMPINVNLNGTISIIHDFVEGAYVKFTGDLPPLQTSTPLVDHYYYVRNPTSNTLQLSSAPDSAIITFISQGSGGFLGSGRIRQLEGKSTFRRWVVTDGNGTGSKINAFGVGDFNSKTAIQEAHDAAAEGDTIEVLVGTYSSILVTKDKLQFVGKGGNVLIDGANLTAACISVSGSYNRFENFTLTNCAKGIELLSGASYNAFAESVIFNSDITTAIIVAADTSGKHYNSHPLLSGTLISGQGVGQLNPTVTVGDGAYSWGDYVGIDALNQAIKDESRGTKIIVRSGTYNPINPLGSEFNGLIIEGTGNAIIDANGYPQCIKVIGSDNRISGLFLRASGNRGLNFSTYGIDVTGSSNGFEHIQFETEGSPCIEKHRRFRVTSGYYNRFVPHTGAATGYISWTVGDGIHSFGDFIGSGGITAALQALPTFPSGSSGIFTATTGSTVTFTANSLSPLTFGTNDLYRYFNITSSANTVNKGSFKVVGLGVPIIVPPNTDAYIYSCTLERTDGLSFVNETNLAWQFTTGAKIWVLPGQYSPFTLSQYDVDIEAWGNGGDTMIVGTSIATTLIQVDGSRCRIKGFRFCGGNPSTCVALAVNGKNNLFEGNRFESAKRYSFGSYATGNQVLDSFESVNRTYIRVSTTPSCGDFVGSSQAAIQAALDLASSDANINRVVLDEGVWTLTSTVNVPAGITLEGSGYKTQLVGNNLFPALTLNSSDGQTIKSIRFSNFNYSLKSASGSLTKVFAYNNWFETAPIDTGSVSGQILLNL